MWVWRCAEQLLPAAFWRSWQLLAPDLAVALVLGLLVGTVLAGLARLAKRQWPWLLLCAVVFATVLMLTMGAGASLVGWVAIAVITLAAATTWGWWLGQLRGHRVRPGRRAWVGLGAVTVAALVMVGVLAGPGPGAGSFATGTARGGMADPTVPGPYRVVSTAYGSGTYTAEAAYGPKVPLTTPSVDASTIIGGWGQGSTRAAVWGFTAAALPLNARVWAPQGAGPFPLVLILHGNSAFTDSETGFAYLATLLASRGYLVASIDENFLNTGLLDKANSITGADAARAWLLLAHLHLWHTFNDTPAGAFAGKSTWTTSASSGTPAEVKPSRSPRPGAPSWAGSPQPHRTRRPHPHRHRPGPQRRPVRQEDTHTAHRDQVPDPGRHLRRRRLHLRRRPPVRPHHHRGEPGQGRRLHRGGQSHPVLHPVGPL